MRKWIVIGLAFAVIAVVVFVVAEAKRWTRATFGPGTTKEETARILVHDWQFGARAKSKAVEYGDTILPLIRLESADFAELNGRNSFWIAEVLGTIKTDRSRSILVSLYSRTNLLAKLTGAVGLAMHGALPEEINEDSFLVGTVRSASGQAETELAMIALGYSKSPEALPCLLDVLKQRGVDYWHHAHACAAVARLGRKDAAPVLRECLRSAEFYALAEAFRALVALGDTEAVPLAIARISPDIKRLNSGMVVAELEKVTDKSFGYDQRAWEKWWQSAKPTWQIPDGIY